jgi:3-dehydroquinate synthase
MTMNILLQQHALDQLGAAVSETVKGRRAFVVTDENVAPLLLERVTCSLKNAGFATASKILLPGEAAKSAENLFALWHDFHSHGITRADAIVALGGGVVGDLKWILPLAERPELICPLAKTSQARSTSLRLPSLTPRCL